MPAFQYLQPKIEEKMPSGWLGKFLRTSIIIFLMVVLFLLFCDLFYKPHLERQVANWENKILNLEKEIPAQDRAEVLTFYSQLVNLKKLLSQHLYPSQIFQTLEGVTHPQVAFFSFSYEFKEGRLKLEGKAQSLGVIAEQLAGFKRAPLFEKINLSGVRKADKDYLFSLDIFFKKSSLLKQL